MITTDTSPTTDSTPVAATGSEAGAACEGVLLRDFVRDPATGLLMTPSRSVPAGYLDGAERLLMQILPACSDRSVASPQLRSHIHDWPTLYHLSPQRSAVLDCFEFTAGDARVLELGSGCGAITRWLGERCGYVAAVEGDVSRAIVARERCADLGNVEIHCANYSTLAERDAFDVVTLIGVLEYGHLYHPTLAGRPAEAAIDNLRVARRALGRDGVLVLAIENRLGTKYLNGAREDHSGRRYESVHGYPHATSAVTFSALGIRRMLAAAGFGESAFFLPYPDYKLASTIINAEHAGPDAGAHNWLPGIAPDRGAERVTPSFHEALAEREFARAGLLPEVANSFLVLAYTGDRAASEERLGVRTDWSARHYALGRRPGLRKRVTIGEPSNRIVRHEPAFDEPAVHEAGVLRHRFADESRIDGELLVWRAHEAMAGPQPDEPLEELLREYRDELLRMFGTGWVDEAGVALLTGEAFDATWWNIVCDPHGCWHWIDREWSWKEPIPVDFVVWRTLFHYAERFRPTFPGGWRDLDSGTFADRWLTRIEPDADEPRLRSLRALEQLALACADGGLIVPAHRDAVKRVCVAASLSELLDTPELLEAYMTAFGPQDEVTLALHCTPERAAEQSTALRELLAASGRPDDSLPAIFLRVTADPTAEGRSRAASAALLTLAGNPADDTPTPRVADAAGLRAIVRARWSEMAA